MHRDVAHKMAIDVRDASWLKVNRFGAATVTNLPSQ